MDQQSQSKDVAAVEKPATESRKVDDKVIVENKSDKVDRVVVVEPDKAAEASAASDLKDFFYLLDIDGGGGLCFEALDEARKMDRHNNLRNAVEGEELSKTVDKEDKDNVQVVDDGQVKVGVDVVKAKVDVVKTEVDQVKVEVDVKPYGGQDDDDVFLLMDMDGGGGFCFQELHAHKSSKSKSK